MATMCIFWLLWWKRPIKTEMDPLSLHCGTTLVFCAQIRLRLSRWQKWSIYEATVGANITNSIVPKEIHKVCVLNFFCDEVWYSIFISRYSERQKYFPCCHVLTVRSDKKYKQTSSISVECKPPTWREHGLHKIWRDVDILLWPWYVTLILLMTCSHIQRINMLK